MSLQTGVCLASARRSMQHPSHLGAKNSDMFRVTCLRTAANEDLRKRRPAKDVWSRPLLTVEDQLPTNPGGRMLIPRYLRLDEVDSSGLLPYIPAHS